MPKRKSKTTVQAQNIHDKVDKLAAAITNLYDNVLPKLMSRAGRAAAEEDASSQHDEDDRSQVTDTERPLEVVGPDGADASAADRDEVGSEASSEITTEEPAPPQKPPPSDNFFSPKQKKIIQKLVESGYTFEREGGIAAVLKRLEGCGAGSLLPDLPICASDPTTFTTPQSAKITAAGQLISLVNVPFVAPLLQHAGEKLSVQWFHALYELVDLHLREFQLTCNELLQLRLEGHLFQSGELSLRSLPDEEDGTSLLREDTFSLGGADFLELSPELKPFLRSRAPFSKEVLDFELSMSREVLETMKREKRISTALVFRLNVIVKCQEFLAQVIKVNFQQVALLPVSHAGKYALIVRT